MDIRKKKVIFFGGLAIAGLFFAMLITGVYLMAHQRELVTAEVIIGHYNDDVKENVSILNEGFMGSGDKLFEGTEMLLKFYNLNESKNYTIMNVLEGKYTDYISGYSNTSAVAIFITIEPTITGIALCAYEYSWNITSLEFYSLTLYPLIWIVLHWS